MILQYHIIALGLQLLGILLQLPLESGSLPNFEQCFPTKAEESAAASFPFVDEMNLYSEFFVIYRRLEFRKCCGAVPKLQLFIEISLADTFSKTVLLLTASIKISMTSCYIERCSQL